MKLRNRPCISLFAVSAAVVSTILLATAALHADDKDDAAKLTGQTPDKGSLPLWSSPKLEDRTTLGQLGRDMERGIFFTGNPEHGTGTAWVISKKHRLLATNSHVADILHDAGGEMVAIPSGTAQVYKVVKVWYHPGVRRYLKNQPGMSIRSTDPREGAIDPYSPDLAILQLESEGPDLTVEFAPATADELKSLFARPAAISGFPGYDNKSWPKLGSKPVATYHDGVISRLTDFSLAPDAVPEELLFVQYTMSTWPGYSGSPVFLPSGHVAAVHNMGRKEQSRGVLQSIPHGIRVDALLDMIVFHGLEDKMPFTIDKSRANVERWTKADEKTAQARATYAKAVALAEEAYQLVYVDEQYTAGVNKCNEAMKLVPNLPAAYRRRGGGFANYWFDSRDRLTTADQLKYLGYAEEDFRKASQLEPSNSSHVLQLAMTYNNIGLVTGRVDGPSRALTIASNLLDSDNLISDDRSFAHSVRGVAYDNLDDGVAALREHDEAVRLGTPKSLPTVLETRADFHEENGNYGQAQADRARARQLRAQAEL